MTSSAADSSNWAGMDSLERARTMRRAWEHFFDSGEVLPFVRAEIAESWVRSRQLGIPPGLRARPIGRGLDRLMHSELRQLLARASEHVLNRLVDTTQGAAMSFTLTDADGLILVQRAERRLLQHNEQIGVLPGTRWAELDVGTNGIGTALARRQTMQVFAAEHYCEAFHGTMCTAALVRHPLTRQPIGVFDITSSYAEPAANVWALATQAATLIEREIEQLLVSNSERLLQTLSARRQDQAAYAVDREGRHTIANRGATATLAPEDYESLWNHVRRSIQSRDERVVPHVLKNGRPILVQVNVVSLAEEPVGALVVLRENRRRGAAIPGRAPAQADDWSPFNPSVAWLRPARAALRSGEPVLVLGEPGSGKSALTTALLRNSHAEPGRVVDCATVEHWAELQCAFDSPEAGAVVLERVLDLSPALQARLVSAVEIAGAAGGPRIVTTACVANEPELRLSGLRQDLVDRLAVHVVRVPPLRERGDEIERITLETLRDLTPGLGHVTHHLSGEAIQVLRTYPWPGNVRQLQNVLRRVLLVHSRPDIDVETLPREILLRSTEPRLGLIEQLEGEAILRTLESTDGNVSKAAQLMGLSRATVYRRLHAYRAQGRTLQHPPERSVRSGRGASSA
jgi:sigma-54 dependent transcriptional regulator, acetoin dehydrogenase operon transcriptional activator AcoR